MNRDPMNAGSHPACRMRVRVLEVLLVIFGAAPLAAQDSSQLHIGLVDAVRIALDTGGNTNVSLAREAVTRARSQSSVERSALLPNLSGSVTDQSRTTNLEALGIAIEVPVPGFQPPGFVGPFETFDARARVTQSLLDWGAVQRYRASRVGVEVAESMSEGAQSEVAARTAVAYTAALQADAQVQAARANVALAESLLELAENRRGAGSGTAIEATRARVELTDQRQRLLAVESDSRQAYLELRQVMHLRLDTPVALDDELGTLPFSDVDLVDPIGTAMGRRADLRAQLGREEAARKRYDGVRAERWPSLQAFGDYGALGSGPSASLPTRSIGIDLRVPIFDGGRREAREAQALSELDQERIRSDALRQQIELEVRLAMDDIATAQAQVGVSEEGLELAGEELERAERRYRAGVTTNIEVVDAQARLERAYENSILARARVQAARIELGRATGALGDMILGP